MEKVKITAKYCYGIQSLEHEFDFSNNNQPAVIYAPNGLMKTSLAKAARDYSSGKKPKDLVFPNRDSSLALVDEDGEILPRDSVFVVDSINDKYQSDRISTLLASEGLKSDYDSIFRDIADKKETLFKKLKAVSGIKRDIEKTFCNDYQLPESQIMTALGRLDREVNSGEGAEFGEFDYKILFNAKVAAFIEKPDFSELIEDYSNTYESILDKSKYFKKGVFNHSNAETIAKNLKANGWFEGGHSVRLNDGGSGLDISDEKELQEAIQNEKNAILSDENLQEKFEKVDSALSNAELRAFRDYIVANPTLLPELREYNYLRNKIWIGYLQKTGAEYRDLIETYDISKTVIQAIVARAEAESTHWERVLEIFNARFSVPFRVAVENKGDAVLGISSPQIVFYFEESGEEEEKKVDRSLLNNVLSNGERRALYILNIIFEVEARRASNLETLFIIDDIADSFDYKNKYAIVEYLGDMRRVDHFHLLIMTHNFDFYRTAKSRLEVYSNNKLLASREHNSISLYKDTISQNPFIEWRDNLNRDEYLIASIPFVRNLAEYTGVDSVFTELTSLLHIKQNTSLITRSKLKEKFCVVLQDKYTQEIQDGETPIIDITFNLCDSLSNSENEEVGLHEKIILAIGIRLLAEKILIKLIDDEVYVESIQSNQTGKLIRKYERAHPLATDNILLMRRVSLMTPENIHLNSFMFEPILDMSAHHLKHLYSNLCALSENI